MMNFKIPSSRKIDPTTIRTIRIGVAVSTAVASRRLHEAIIAVSTPRVMVRTRW